MKPMTIAERVLLNAREDYRHGPVYAHVLGSLRESGVHWTTNYVSTYRDWAILPPNTIIAVFRMKDGSSLKVLVDGCEAEYFDFTVGESLKLTWDSIVDYCS